MKYAADLLYMSWRIVNIWSFIRDNIIIRGYKSEYLAPKPFLYLYIRENR